jgi:hypothetical protein
LFICLFNSIGASATNRLPAGSITLFGVGHSDALLSLSLIAVTWSVLQMRLRTACLINSPEFQQLIVHVKVNRIGSLAWVKASGWRQTYSPSSGGYVRL